MKLKLLLILVLAAMLAGCASAPTTATAPPSPPMPPTPQGVSLKMPKTSKVAKASYTLLSTRTMAVASLHSISTPETNVIYLSREGTNLVVSWMTNDYSRSFFIYTTNLSMPVEGWTTPYEWGDLRTTNGPLISVRFTNDVPMAFFRLVTVDTNTAGISWHFDPTNYQTIQSYTNVTKYIVRYGNQTNVYTNLQMLPGARLWHTITFPTLQTNWCVGGEAYYSTNGVMGFAETYWPPRQ